MRRSGAAGRWWRWNTRGREEGPGARGLGLDQRGAEADLLDGGGQVAGAALEGVDAGSQEGLDRCGLGGVAEAGGQPGQLTGPSRAEPRDQGLEVRLHEVPGGRAGRGARGLALEWNAGLVQAQAR